VPGERAGYPDDMKKGESMKAMLRLSLAAFCLLAVLSTASAQVIGPGKKLEPIAADLVVTRTDESGNLVTTTNRFYRDSAGRTRVEEPALQKTQTSLGYRATEGWTTEGREYTIVIPANSKLGNKAPVTKRVRLWLSQDLKLPVTTEIDDPTNGPSTHRYINIVAGTEPDAALFQVPSGYSVQPAPSGPLASRKCTLTINPDPLIIHSFGFLLGRGTVAATTNANRGCFIAAWAAIWENPLRLQVLTPVGLPAFSVRWRDSGANVPFTPWVAFGDIAILATNFLDTTTKDGLVILTVWF
jgi:hypothetical protein